MSWTTFANLTNPTLVELDGNFGILSGLVPVPCTVSGTNSLTLTSNAAAAANAGYQQNMILVGVAVATNTTAATAQLGSLAALPIYKDTAIGPVALSGGEIIQSCFLQLTYDSALNSGGGGFHLSTGVGELIGQTVTVASILAGSGSLSSLTVGGAASLTSLSASGPSSLVSLSIAGGSPILRYNSTLTSVIFTAIVPQASQDQTVTFSGVKLSDDIQLGWSVTPTASIVFSAFPSAAGSVVVRALNPLTGATITPGTLTLRLTQIGFT